MLLLLLALTAHASDLSPKAQKKADKLDARAASELAACAEDDAPCLAEVVARWDGATVKDHGEVVPVELPTVEVARASVHAWRVEAVVEQWLGEVEAAWASLEPRLGQPDAALLADLTAFVDRFVAQDLTADGEVLRPTSELLDRALDARDQVFVGLRTTVVADVPWQATVRTRVPVQQSPRPKLRIQSALPNQVTDDDAWFERNALTFPASFHGRFQPGHDLRPAPAVPDALLGGDLSRVIVDGHPPVAIYGRDGVDDVVGVFDGDGVLVRAFDLAAFRRAPAVERGDEDFVEQGVTWATRAGDVLLVSSAHRTYAESSRGKNAYVTAFDVASGALLWRSPPLVSNALSFVVAGSHVITGYGFTAEPDFLYSLDLATGAVETRVKVKSGPTWLLVKDGWLHVRCYDTDYVVGL